MSMVTTGNGIHPQEAQRLLQTGGQCYGHTQDGEVPRDQRQWEAITTLRQGEEEKVQCN